MTVKILSYEAIISVNSLYLIIDKINGYIEESNRNKYLAVVPPVEWNDTLKKYEELWGKFRYFNRSMINNFDNYDEKYMKIKFNSDDDLPLKKTLKFRNMIIVVRSVFHKDNKYNPLSFLRLLLA